MSVILGLRSMVRIRYTATSFVDGRLVDPAGEVRTDVMASPDFAPAGRRQLDPSGKRTVRTLELVSWDDFRAASAIENRRADRIEYQGRTYEVTDVHFEEPFEGEVRGHYETIAVEVQPIDGGAT